MPSDTLINYPVPNYLNPVDDLFGPLPPHYGPSFLREMYYHWWRREQLRKYAREWLLARAEEFMEEANKTHQTIDSTESPA